MTALTTIPAPTPTPPPAAAARPHLVDVPTDYRPHVRGRRGEPHRFPAATYLCRSVAREERDVARASLDAVDRSASRRTGGLGAVVALLFAAALFVLATGRAETRSGVVTLAALGVLAVVTIVTLVGVLRSHEREHDVLAERVRMYDARLLELRPRR
ncbi:hypothetical protein [Terrabacter carboxydivorans]|uniref:Integral membrane protein n=1 Tax=Terrabacter carboxydivorans TaxID=619730 RepID=A0ABN3KU78_9MICO